jgi:hypothetical protein
MLQSRRVIDITNTICNYIFLVFLLLFGIYASSFWKELDATFVSYVVDLTANIGITVSLISAGVMLVDIVLIFIDHKFKFGQFLACLLRILFSVLIMIFMYALCALVESGFEVRL